MVVAVLKNRVSGKYVIVRKQIKLHILPVLWVLVSRTLSEHGGLSNSTRAVGWHVDFCTCACTYIFYHVFLWNLNQLWFSYSFDSGVVGLEINMWYCFRKCELLLFVPLPEFSATSQTLSLRHPTRLPVTHLLHNASGIEVLAPGRQVPGQVA